YAPLAPLLVITRSCSQEHIGVCRDPHRRPAHPRAAILLISSIDKDGPSSLFRKSKASEILPVGRAALTSIRPSGSFSTLIFSPGPTPRCFRISLRNVT